jgi:integrase
MQYNITYRQKDKGWQYIISYKDADGKWKQKSKQGFEKSRTGKDEAKAAAEEALKLLKASVELKTPADYKDITFGDFGKRYIDNMKLYREYKTTQSTQTVLNRFNDLNDLLVFEITTVDIQEVVDKLMKEGLNPNTIKYYIKKLNILFNAAKNEYKIINVVPTKNIKTGKAKDIDKRALNESEVEDLLKKLEGTEYYLLVYITVNSGMRIGEVLGLTWSNIDFNKKEIKVVSQWKKLKDGSYNFGELKTKNSARVIPISKDTVEELKKHRTVISLDNRILGFKNKDRVIATVNRIIKRCDYDISIHELRHTYASKLAANRMDYKTIAYIMGHDVKETIKTYSHFNSDMLDKARSLIENIF